MEEVHMVVRVARRYQQRELDFCIITFYDPQRAAIIKALEKADLQSERVYNVDSFQGMCDTPHISITRPDSAR
jgi:superfamily I DNA and/or RNA helicase